MKNKIYINKPSIKIRKRFDKLCDGDKFLFNHPTDYQGVFFPEFEAELKLLLPPPAEYEQYNCFAYAIGLDMWVRKAVIAQAIKNGELTRTDSPKASDIVVYYGSKEDPFSVRHAGRYISSLKVASKWAGGPVFEHDVFTCPFTYGDRVSHFNAIPKEEAEELLKKYSHLND